MERRTSMDRAYRQLMVALMASAAVVSTPAWAQSQAAPTAGDQKDPAVDRPGETTGQLESIVVTARRVEENQQDVPIAVTTISNTRLQEAAIESVQDIQKLAPSLQISQSVSGQQQFTLRGSFGGLAGGLGSDPAVITYVDDVPIDPRTVVYSLFDIGSVQVLKGPQGTLFGKNSTGGAVLFSTNRPNFKGFGGYVTARYGTYNERRLEGAINAPLTETLAVRLAGEIERRGGLEKSVTVPGLEFENRHNAAVRVSALWRPTDSIENFTQATHYRVHEHRYAPRPTMATNCTGPTTPSVICRFSAPFNAALGTDDIQQYIRQQLTLPRGKSVADYPYPDNVRRDDITNSLSVDLGAVRLRNISYYGRNSLNFGIDFDGTPADVYIVSYGTKFHVFSSETQLLGSLFSDRLKWVVGGVYSQEKGSVDQFTNLFGLPVDPQWPSVRHNEYNYKTAALFGQGTYDLSDWLHGVSITAGYRHTWDKRALNQVALEGTPVQRCSLQTLPVPASGPVPFPFTDLSTCRQTPRLKSDDFNYNFSIEWKPTKNLLIYAATRKGYKAAGFNTSATTAEEVTYQPEVNKDVEVGFKLDGRVANIPFRLNAAAYRSKYTNIQQTVVLLDRATGRVSLLILNQDAVTGLPNIARTKGFEIEANVIPAPWLELQGFYSQSRAKYKQFVSPLPRRDLAGENVSGVIPGTFGVTAQLKPPSMGDYGQLKVLMSYYKSEAPLKNVLTTVSIPSRSSLDARLSIDDFLRPGLGVAVFGRNLEDKVFCTVNTAVTGDPAQSCSEGATYGVEASFRF